MGRFITDENYDLFLDIMSKSLILNGFPSEYENHKRFIDALIMVRNFVV
jgi:hypothetical protein